MASRRRRRGQRGRRRLAVLLAPLSLLLVVAALALLYREEIYDRWLGPQGAAPVAVAGDRSPAERLEEAVILGARELGVPHRRIGRRLGEPGRPHYEFRCPDRLHPITANRWLTRILADAEVAVIDCKEEGSAARPKLNYLLGLDGEDGARATLTLFPPIGDPPLGAAQPRLAIIVDDFGHNYGRIPRGLLDLGVPITASILPGRSRSKRLEREARYRGHAVFMHLPLEPLDYPEQDPGYGAIFSDMSPDSIRRRLDLLQRGFQQLDGFNHHMGSKASTVDAVVGPILDWAEREHLLVVDSYTAKGSRIYPLARKRDLPALRVDLFLDGEEETEPEIMENLARAAAIAHRRGWAVVICHPRPETLAALRKMVPRLTDYGLKFVTVPQLLAGLDASDPAPPPPERPGPH